MSSAIWFRIPLCLTPVLNFLPRSSNHRVSVRRGRGPAPSTLWPSELLSLMDVLLVPMKDF